MLSIRSIINKINILKYNKFLNITMGNYCTSKDHDNHDLDTTAPSSERMKNLSNNK
jgi:hypothetical protein